MRLTAKYIYSFFGLSIVRVLLFSVFLLALCRIAWYFSVSNQLQTVSISDFIKTMVVGVYMDTPVLGWFFLPVWIWMLVFPRKAENTPKATAVIYTICSAPAITLTAIDCAYSQVTGKRSGTELISLLTDNGNKIMPYFQDYWWGILILLGTFYLVYKFVPVRGNTLYIYRKNSIVLSSLTVLAVLFMWLTLARGGWREKPLVSMDAAEYAGSELAAVASSTPLQFISTFGVQKVNAFQFMKISEAESLVLRKPTKTTAVKKKNVVIIIIESLGRDYTGFLNHKPFTPFLDSLSEKSTNLRFCFANGTRSAEMVPSIFCGIPSLMDNQYINSPYASNKARNIFNAWEQQGYQTAFFHGGRNGTMRFQSFLAQTGMANYCGLDQYPQELRKTDYDGNWGIFDEPYLQYFKDCLDTFRQPFLTAVFTLSSHHPYAIPPKWQGKLPKGELPIHQTVAYTDASLRSFFKAASKARWFNNTIFIITADHTSYSKNAYFYSETGHYEIPLLFYSPGESGRVIDKTTSQCDIIPTLEDIAGVQTSFFGMGRSVFDSSYAGYSVHRSEGKNFIVHYPYTLGMNDNGDVTDFYSRHRNETVVKHLPRAGSEFDSMQKYLKAYLQVYADRLINNNWK